LLLLKDTTDGLGGGDAFLLDEEERGLREKPFGDFLLLGLLGDFVKETDLTESSSDVSIVNSM